MNNTTKQKPSGYWNNYENNKAEAKKYNSRREFKKGCQSAYQVARKNGWLDTYTWFTEKKKPSGYWTYETCFQEAKKYNSKTEFEKGCSSAYQVARKNGWLDIYIWFEEKQKPSGYWNYETCFQEAKKYNSRGEFEKGCQRAYYVARQNGWLDTYTWFSVSKTAKKWNEQTCYQEAQKYNSRKEFQKGCSGAYEVARINSWLETYTWFETKQKPSGYWENYENNKTEAKKYNSRFEFQKGCSGAYHVARKNGWLDTYTWFKKDLDPYKNKLDNVYAFIFTELNSVYIGRSINVNNREKQHNTNKKSSVYKFAQQNNVSIPQITLLEIKLNLDEGREKEHYYVTKYKQEGWNVLNRAKTGKNCGSLGALDNRKWNKKTCYQEAQKYNSRGEFAKGCSGAYHVARINSWLETYTWFISTNELKKIIRTKWTYETCFKEAKKYNSRKEFEKGCNSAYNVALKNGWLETYTWFETKQKPSGYWENYENNKTEAKKYNSRYEFKKGCSSAYQVANINGWLDTYTWFKEKQKHNYWNKQTCFQEAKKYNSRGEFAKGCQRAYEVARINGWLDIFFPKTK